MKIGIMSDTHNHVDNIRQVLDIFRERHVERIIHCGDITTHPIIELFEGWTATFVFGNMDRGHADMMTLGRDLFGMGSIGYAFTAEWEGVRIAACHGDDTQRLDEFIRSGLYDYVFHGHTHLRRDEKIGDTRVINPGALGGQRKQTRSACVLDTDTGQADFIELED